MPCCATLGRENVTSLSCWALYAAGAGLARRWRLVVVLPALTMLFLAALPLGAVSVASICLLFLTCLSVAFGMWEQCDAATYLHQPMLFANFSIY